MVRRLEMDVYVLFCVFCVLFNLTESHYRSYVGCYEDNGDWNRVLPHHRFDSFSSMTNDGCAIHCCTFLNDASYSGTEKSNECYCGNTESISSTLRENECTDLCSGNSSDTCGAHLRLSISKLNCSEIRRTECQVLPTVETEVETTVVVPKVDLDATISAITEQIRVDKTKTGSYRRSKISAYDDRKSAQYIGVGGIVVIVLPIITVILSDLLNLFKCKHTNKKDKKDFVN